MNPLIYISGPYSADTLIEREQNIANARRRMIWALSTRNWWPVCPHTHTAGLEMHLPDFEHTDWMHFDIAMLAGCDALWVVMPTSYATYSCGVALEIAWAQFADMPIYAEFADPGYEALPLPLAFVGSRPGHIPQYNPAYPGSETERYYASAQLAIARDAIRQYVDDGSIPDPKTYRGSCFRRGA